MNPTPEQRCNTIWMNLHDCSISEDPPVTAANMRKLAQSKRVAEKQLTAMYAKIKNAANSGSMSISCGSDDLNDLAVKELRFRGFEVKVTTYSIFINW